MTKLVKFRVAVVLIGVCTGGAFAQDRTEAAQAAVKSMARETVECAAYYDIVSLVLLNANERDTSQQYVKARKLAVERANSLSPGIVDAHYNDIIRDMTKTIAMANIPKKVDESLSNISLPEISVLGNKYGNLCKEVLNAPGERAKYWMEHAGAPSP